MGKHYPGYTIKMKHHKGAYGTKNISKMRKAERQLKKNIQEAEHPRIPTDPFTVYNSLMNRMAEDVLDVLVEELVDMLTVDALVEELVDELLGRNLPE